MNNNSNEKRRFARTDVNISITLKQIASPYEIYNYDGITIDANAINLSPKGIAFTTTTNLELNSSYLATIHYKDFNPFVIIMKIVNIQTDAEGYYTYGCQFEGINKNMSNTPLFKELCKSIED